MKFCKHCGSQIADDAVCNCPAAVAERQGQAAPQQPAPYASPYAAQGAAQPAGESKFVKSLKNVPQVLLSYFKNPKEVVATCKQTGDVIVAAAYTFILFIALLAANSCIFGKICVVFGPFAALSSLSFSASSASVLGFNFGFVLLAALMETVAITALYTLGKFVLIALNVKPLNAGKAITDSFISFGVNSIVPIASIIVGGLFYMLTSFIANIFFIFAAAWYIIAALSELKDELPPAQNSFVRILTTALVVGAALFLYGLIYNASFMMNLSGASVSTVDFMFSMVSSVTSSLGGLSGLY